MPRKTNDIVPTFLLKSIDFKNVLKKYMDGYFTIENLDKTPITKNKNDDTKIIQVSKQVNDKKEGNFIEKFRNIPSLYYATGNNDIIAYYKTNNEQRTNVICQECNSMINHKCISIPVKYICKSVIEVINGESIYKNYHIFWGIGEYCDFKCAHSFLLKGRTIGFTLKDFHYNDSERYLKIYYSLMYPNEPPLCENNDPKILETNGGSVNIQDYNKYRYIKTPGLILYPIVDEYIRI